MTEQRVHETMASRGQAAHKPDPKPTAADQTERGRDYLKSRYETPVRSWGDYGRLTDTPHLSMTERVRVAEFDAAPEPSELVVERVARALCDGDAADHGTYDWAEADGELQDDYRRAARHAIAAMEEI